MYAGKSIEAPSVSRHLPSFHDVAKQTHRCHGFPIPVPEELVPLIEAESNYQEGAQWDYPTYQEYGAAAYVDGHMGDDFPCLRTEISQDGIARQ